MVNKIKMNEGYPEPNYDLWEELNNISSNLAIYRGDVDFYKRALDQPDLAMGELAYDEFVELLIEWVDTANDFLTVAKKLNKFARTCNIFDIY